MVALHCADAVFGENLDALQQAIAQHVSQNPAMQGQVCFWLMSCLVILCSVNVFSETVKVTCALCCKMSFCILCQNLICLSAGQC